MQTTTELKSGYIVLAFTGLSALLAASLWLGNPWCLAMQAVILTALTGVPIAHWLLNLVKREMNQSYPQLQTGRYEQIREWIHRTGLPCGASARGQALADMLAKGIGPKSSPEDIAWLLEPEVSPRGEESLEMYAAVLSAAFGRHREVAAVLATGINPGTQHAILKVLGDDKSARWIHEFLGQRITDHGYWSTIVVSIKSLATRSVPGSIWMKCEDFAFLKTHRPELWAAVSSAGSPSCHIDGVGIMSHFYAEEALGAKIEHLHLCSGVDALSDMVENA